ncbi:MAG: segregation/condensation protein A [Myxococcales bacterium]|nr:segregation/condensation protein A [Myxococcales bacterium]
MSTMDLEQEYQVELPDFEGPLDLLLHLVKRHELEILEIPIAFITEKYLEYLDLMRALNLDVAGEYLLMAATLAQIKSNELLPRPEVVDEDDDESDLGDPRAELIKRLLEYQRYKEVAHELGQRPALGRHIFPRGSEMPTVDASERPLAEVGVFALLDALARVMRRNDIKMQYDVVVDRISITDRINEIVDRLAARTTVPFLDCFDLSGGEAARHEIVVTFLAILELARLRMIRIVQRAQAADASADEAEPGDEEILITRTAALENIDDAEASFAATE